MVWSSIKDEILCRETLLLEPYKPKQRSRDNVWKQIAEDLNLASNDNIYFRVDHRAFRDKFNLLLDHHEQKLKDQGKAKGYKFS